MLSLKKLKKSLESLLKADNNDFTKHLHDALDQALDDPSPSLNSWIANNISDPRVRSDHLTRAIERPGYASRTAREAFQNPIITTEHVNFGLSHPSREIQQTTFTHAPLTEEQVSKEWDHPRNQEWGHKHNIALGLFNNSRAKIPSKVFDFIRNENAEPKLVHASMSHTDTPVEHARWGLHPANSFHVNKAALSHPGLESKDLVLPLKSHSAEVRTAAASHPNISKDQLLNVIKNDQKTDVIHAALDNPRVDRDVVKEILTKPVLSIGPREIDKLVNHPSMDQEIFEDALKNQLPGSDKNALMLYGKRFINGNHIHDLINKDEAETLQSIEPTDNRVTPDHVHKAFYSLNTRPDTKRWALNSNHVTEQMLTDSLAATPDDVGYGTAEDAVRSKNLTPKHLSIALEHPKLTVQFAAAKHPNLSTENIDQALGNEHYVVRRDAIKNANATEEQIKRALKDDDKEVVAAAKEKPIGQMLHLQHNPDKHQVKVKFDTGKLRQIRDYIDEKGGIVSKKEIEGLGYNLQSLGLNTQLDHKGNLSSQKVKDIIDSKPEHKFGYSFEKWDGPQRHSNKDSNVFQLNLTHDQYKELNDRGLLPTFQEVQKLSKQSSHPVKDHTIGWVRYTKSKDGTQIDEVQSDLGQGLVKQLKNMKEDNPDINIDPEKVNEINHVIFKGKHPSELIHESFLQAMRDRGEDGKDIHIWGKEPKAALAGMRDDEQLPAHMIEGYEKIPKKLGYQEGKYGELKTQRNKQLHGSQTWKHKLRKSLPHKDGKYHASMVAVFVGPEMLFIRRDDSGLLTRPGGHAEPGEDALSAAVRELNEEVGIIASPEQLKFVGKKETPRHGGGSTVVSVFKLNLPSKPELDYSKDPDQEASSCVWSQPSLIKESEMHHKPDVVVELLKPKSLKQLKKSVEDLKPKQGWLIKIEGEEGYHPLKDIKDLGYNQGNNYVLHDGREIHQSHIEDMIPSSEEKLKKYIPDMPPPQAEVREVEPPIVTHPTIRFYKGPDMSVVKNVISQIESSGGKFREHPEVKVGIHAGTKAHSSYGLMPRLMQELAQKKKDFAQTPTGLKILASGSPEEVSNITADKKHDDEAMRHLWEYNQSRIKKFAPKGADLELLGAYAHRRGIKGTYDALQNGGLEAIHKDPYVSKFQQLRNKIKSMGKSLESDVIPGGLSDKKSDKDFDPKLVKEGVKVELEHTSDPKIAKEISQDHLSESPNYYKMLRKLESLIKSKFDNNRLRKK